MLIWWISGWGRGIGRLIHSIPYWISLPSQRTSSLGDMSMATSSSWAGPKSSLTRFYNTLPRWSKLVMARVSCLSWHCQKCHTLSITVWRTLNVRVETESGQGPLSIWCARRKGWKDRENGKGGRKHFLLVLGSGWRGTCRHSESQHPTQTPMLTQTRHLKFLSASSCSAHCQPLT